MIFVVIVDREINENIFIYIFVFKVMFFSLLFLMLMVIVLCRKCLKWDFLVDVKGKMIK